MNSTANSDHNIVRGTKLHIADDLFQLRLSKRQ